MNEKELSMYEEFDAELLAKIESGKSSFTAICGGELQEKADRLAKPTRFNDKNGWRLIDRRLQALRKKGLIVSRKGAWHPL